MFPFYRTVRIIYAVYASATFVYKLKIFKDMLCKLSIFFFTPKYIEKIIMQAYLENKKFFLF